MAWYDCLGVWESMERNCARELQDWKRKKKRIWTRAMVGWEETTFGE